MAEAIGLASGVLSFALLASKSSIALYNTVQGIRTQPKRVRDLADELRAVSEVLYLLTDTIDVAPGNELSALDTPLRRGDEACKEFEQEPLRCSSRSSGDRASTPLADAQLRRSVTTAENLENYQTMIKTTTDDLEARLENIDANLAAIIEHIGESTQKCLELSAQLANRISYDAHTHENLYPEHTVADVEKHMQQLMDRLIVRSSTQMSLEHDVAQLTRLREGWTTAGQCLDICSQAESHVEEDFSIIDNYATGDDTVQFLVSTTGKTIYGKNRGYGSTTRIGGRIATRRIQLISQRAYSDAGQCSPSK
ncbi:hypothetical protein BDP55DRAFT_695372 [Colletotrichum godetiae]|uniref:Azaphilone pigments biosynthesis cluster protein L N-terminal domain-containing protein n=1 Tax=Colletotrichum godetiae TaxID=1209918 RepID=A0AAJ0AGW6_9PEZI|nr:uncharacterized protein BDP55DRAFT_695372 [Colletotrichum godetiae]KAK1673683.1 hypothetical protein BDP55DRAFT_695372 [Colletotrichum godetiae]